MTDPTTPAPALVLGLSREGGMRLPPPWFVTVEAPGCGATLGPLPAEAPALFLVCDRIAGHDGRHRTVTDNQEGLTIEWGEELASPS